MIFSALGECFATAMTFACLAPYCLTCAAPPGEGALLPEGGGGPDGLTEQAKRLIHYKLKAVPALCLCLNCVNMSHSKQESPPTKVIFDVQINQ